MEEVARRLGIEVRRHRALCFLHDDHHPSLVFSTEKNLWWCFVCGDGGGPVKLVQAYLGLPFVEACRWLQQQFGLAPADYSPIAPARSRPPAQPRPRAPRPGSESDREMLRWLFDHAVLSAEAEQFLFRERHYSPEAVHQLGVKSVSNSANLVKNLVYLFGEERSLASGLVVRGRDGRLHGYFQAPCLLFPYRDAEGSIISVQSRYLGADRRVPRFQFLKGLRVGLFNLPVLHELSADEPLYLSEGVTDCLAHLTQGHKAVAIPSATVLHAEDLAPLQHRHLVIYPDADLPGQRLSEKLRQLLAPLDATLEVRPLPEGCKDYSEAMGNQELRS